MQVVKYLFHFPYENDFIFKKKLMSKNLFIKLILKRIKNHII